MKPFHFSPFLSRKACLVALVLSFGVTVRAATVTWTGPDGGDWNTGSNWSGSAKPLTADTALFNTPLTSVTNALADQTVTSISFGTDAGTASGGFAVGTTGGNKLTLSHTGTIQILGTLTGTGKAISINAPIVLTPANATSAGAYTFANNNTSATNTLSFGGAISGGTTTNTVTLTLGGGNTGINTIAGNISNGSAASLALVKSGAGTWVLSGSNTYTGNTTLADGNIDIASTSSLGVGGTISVTASGGNIYGPNAQLIVRGTNDPLTGHIISMATGSRVGINVVDATNSVNLSGTISGSGNIFKKGLGTLRLSGNNTGFSGPFTLGDINVSNGTVEFTNNNSFGTGTINGNYSASVVMKNVSGGLVTLPNAISNVNGSASFYFGGADTTLNGNQSGSNGFYAATGTNLTLGGQINGALALGAGTGYFGTFYLNTASGSTSYLSSIAFNGATTVGIAVDNAFGVTTGAQYTDARTSGLTLFASGADRSINSAVRWGGYNGVANFTGSYNLTFSANQNAAWYNTNFNQAFNVTAPMLTFSGIINETTANIWKNGSGVMVLSGSNTYTTQTRLSQGVIRATDGVGLPATSNLYFAGNGGVLETSGTFSRTLGTTAGQVQWAPVGYVGDLVVAGGNGVGAGGFAAFGGPLAVQLNNGTAAVTWNSGNFVRSGGALVLGSTTANNVVDFRNAINLNGLTGTVRVNDNPNTTADYAIISGVISGTGASNLSKTGSGTLVLTNNNTYSGATNITQGKLLVNGSLGNTAITISPGAALGGTGSIGSNLTIGNGAILAPGNSPGTLSGTTATWAGAGVYQWEINNALSAQGNDPGWDFLNLSGALTVSATSGNQFVLQILGLDSLNASGLVGNFDGSQSYTWNIATAGGGVLGFNANAFQINTTGFTNPLLGGQFSIGQSGNNVQLSFTPLVVIPEPSRAVFLLICLSSFLINRSRKAGAII